MRNVEFKPSLQAIKMIRQDNLSEREFYHRIMAAVHRLGYQYRLTAEEAKEFQDALIAQGCVSYQEYAEREQEKGNSVPKEFNNNEIANGEICAAVSIIGQILFNPDNGDRIAGNICYINSMDITKDWIEGSRRRLDMDKYYRHQKEDMDAYTGHDSEEPIV